MPFKIDQFAKGPKSSLSAIYLKLVPECPHRGTGIEGFNWLGLDSRLRGNDEFYEFSKV